MPEGIGLDLGTLAIGITGDNSDWIRKQRQTARQVAALDRSTATVDAKMNTTHLARGIAKSEGMLGRFAARGKMILAAMFIGLATAAVALSARFFKGAVIAASDAEEAVNKFRVTFGEVPAEADAVAKAFSKSFGVASSTARVLLGDTGDLLSGFGFTGKAALDLSKRTNELAADLASFTNIEGGTTRASKALTKALLGERESVKELGIAILEEDVKKQVALDRSNGLTYATMRQAKAYATITIALSQSKNAIGDYARTQGGLANTLRRTAERFKEVKEIIGKFLIDIFDLEQKARDWDSFIAELVEGAEKWRDSLLDVIVFVKKMWAAFGVLFHNIAIGVAESIDHWITFGEWLWTIGKKVTADLSGLFEDLATDIAASFDRIAESIQNSLAKVGFLLTGQDPVRSAEAYLAVWQKVEKEGIDAIVAERAKLTGKILVTGESADRLPALDEAINAVRRWRTREQRLGRWTHDREMGFIKRQIEIKKKGLGMTVEDTARDEARGTDLSEEWFKNIRKGIADLGIEPPDFIDWTSQYKSYVEAGVEVDEWAQSLRDKWADDKADRDKRRSKDREKEEDKAMAKRIHAGALERGTQAAFKAAQRPGMDPQKQIEKNTKEMANSAKEQVAEQKKTNKRLEDAPVLMPAGV